ncbi:hypothetical protein Bca4012_094785 [Brassica carinata]
MSEYEGKLVVLYMWGESKVDDTVTKSVRCKLVSVHRAGDRICGTIDWSGVVGTWREADQAVESDRSSGGVRWIAGGGTSGVDLMEQVTERARWKSLEQTTEKVNRLSDRASFEAFIEMIKPQLI